MITLNNVVKSYAGTTVLGPVDLTIPAGGITALVGPNGAGKSTLLTIIGRLLTADSGTITVGGADIAQTPSRQLAKRLSILRQENHFITRLTVQQLIAFGRFPHSQGRLTAADQEHIARAIDFLGLTNLRNRFLDQLSGGQRQRAYVAMVLAQDTDYILLDEPLNNLDIHHAVGMMQQLRRAADELHKTFVIVIHDINFAAAYADHIVALKDGQLAFSGSPAETMRKEFLEPLFNTPLTVSREREYPLAIYYR